MRAVDKLSGRGIRFGLTCGLIAYVLLLQGLVNAYAKTLMAVDPFDPMLVICAPSGKQPVSAVDPFDRMARDSCDSLCNATAGFGPAIEPPAAETYLLLQPPARGLLFQTDQQDRPRGHPGMAWNARAPPIFSI